MSVWCNVDGPTAHWSDEYESLVPKAHKSDSPLVRKPISLTTHWSENPLTSPKYKNNSSRHIYFSPKSITPKSISLKKKCVIRPTAHWSEKVSLGPKSHWSNGHWTHPLVWNSENLLVRRPIGRKTQWSKREFFARSLSFFSRSVYMLVMGKTDKLSTNN